MLKGRKAYIWTSHYMRLKKFCMVMKEGEKGRERKGGREEEEKRKGKKQRRERKGKERKRSKRKSKQLRN